MKKLTPKDVTAALEALEPEARVAFLSDVSDVYCFHCGYPQPKDSLHRCQCWNDE